MTLDSVLHHAVQQVATASSGFISGDARAFKEHWSHADDVTIFGGYGSFEHGWGQVGPRLDWAAAQFRAGATHYEPITAGSSGDLAYAIGIERGTATVVDQDEPGTLVLRVTHLFRREGEQWKLIHRHADALIDILAPHQTLQPT